MVGEEHVRDDPGALRVYRDSARILNDKLDEIEAAAVDLVVAVNPGCLRQLQTGLRRRRSPVRAVHLAELLADGHDQGAT